MLKIPSVPAGAPVWEQFTCTLNGKPAAIHAARVSKYPYNRVWPGAQRPLDQTELSGFLSVESDEPIEVCLEVDRDFDEVVIRPLSKNVRPVWSGRMVEFTVTEPGSYVVELDDQHENFTLFVNPVRDFGVSPEEEKVLYFGPGVHHPGNIEVTSGQTVYIDAEAVVYGTISAYEAHDVSILGYGVLDGSEEKRTHPGCYPWIGRACSGNFPETEENALFKQQLLTDEMLQLPMREIRRLMDDEGLARGTLQFWHGEHIRVEGVVLRDSAVFVGRFANVDRLLINNAKSIGMWRYNSDGFDLLNSRNVVIENCFLRQFDDCIVVKGVEGFHAWNNENIVVRGCVVWCDWGAALELGAETVAPEYKNILFEDCDLIRGGEYMRIHHHNCAEIHHIVYRNIRCEFSKHHHSGVYQHSDELPYTDPKPVTYGRLIALPVVAGGYGEKKAPFVRSQFYRNGCTHHVRFENIQVYLDDGVPQPRLEFEGVDAEHIVSDVEIIGLYVNGEKITDPAWLTCNEFTHNITLK